MNLKSTVASARLLLALMCCLWAPALQAQPVTTVQLPPGLFGNLDQRKTICGNYGCGPTAVTNSFVYLQHYYGGLSTVPKAPAAPRIITDDSESGLIRVANELAGLMKCSSSTGTSGSCLIEGKKSYLQGRTGGWDYVVTSTSTITWEWLVKTVKEGVDVEILIGGHYVTVTGYTWNDQDADGQVDKGEATLNIIDPYGDSPAPDPADPDYAKAKEAFDNDAAVKAALLEVALEVSSTGALIVTGYDLDETTAEVPPLAITDGFSEQLVPGIPEPSTWWLLMAGLGLVMARRQSKGSLATA